MLHRIGAAQKKVVIFSEGLKFLVELLQCACNIGDLSVLFHFLKCGFQLLGIFRNVETGGEFFQIQAHVGSSSGVFCCILYHNCLKIASGMQSNKT